MPIQGKILYDWPNAKIEESLVLSALDQLGTEPYDVTIVGAGVVGCAIAYNLSQYQLRVLLVDKRYDVGEGTSKGNSAIIATGFDATPGSLEWQLVTQASRMRRKRNVSNQMRRPKFEAGFLFPASLSPTHLSPQSPTLKWPWLTVWTSFWARTSSGFRTVKAQ